MSINRSVIFDRAKAVASLARLQAEVVIGFFYRLLSLTDTANVSDSDSRAVGKVLSDSSSVSESEVKAVGKGLSDSPVISESHVYDFGKALSDSSLISEAHVVDLSKVASDSFSASDDQVFAFGKTLSDSVGVTDDVDGEASVLDDQEMQFFKSTSNVANVSESHVKLTQKVTSDSASASDSGSYRGQNYCAFDYFAEDYVGFSGTF